MTAPETGPVSSEHLSTSTPGAQAPAPTGGLSKQERSLQLALAAAQTAAENKGQDVVILDLRDLTCIFDYFVIASGTSRRQLHAISDDIDDRLQKDLNDKRMGIEGYDGSSWILLDYGTIVVHLFDAETRDYYAIEKLWGEANQIDWQKLV